jgi:hypothetical protein
MGRVDFDMSYKKKLKLKSKFKEIYEINQNATIYSKLFMITLIN